jgi:hypothetical protein
MSINIPIVEDFAVTLSIKIAELRASACEIGISEEINIAAYIVDNLALEELEFIKTRYMPKEGDSYGFVGQKIREIRINNLLE